MHHFVFLNGELIPATDARISAVSAAALYGRGVFTTVAILDGQPFLWKKHRARLESDAASLNIPLIPLAETADLLGELIQANSVIYGRARITIFDESPGGAWQAGPKRGPSMLIMTGDLAKPPHDLRLTVSPFQVNSCVPLAGIKSCNYLEKLVVMDEARGRGFHEAVQLNERGEIASACTANLFWTTDGRIFTPSLKTGCLAGTTRSFIIENSECEEVDAGSDALENADGIFITSAGIGIRRVDSLDGKLLGTGAIEIKGFPRYP